MSTLTVVALQTELKWQDAEANRRHFESQMTALKDVDLVVLPEMFNNGFSMSSQRIAELVNGPTLAWMQTQAKRLDAAVTGSIAVQDNGHFYNRMYWVTPDGHVQHYDKRHLFRMAGEDKRYSPGKQRVVVTWRGLRFCLQVCYDLRFPVFSRQRGDYDVLIYVANWPGARAHAWKTLLPARAVENQCFVVGVNRVGKDGNDHDYSGDSVIYDFLGQPLASAEPGEPKALRAELDGEALRKFRETFPAGLDADGFVLDMDE